MISVIVPVYNVEPYLRKCLDSIVNQTYRNLEILVIDDGSTDSSGKICDEYAQDSRVRVFHTENRGLSCARNLGVENAKGEWLGFVDSDDWIEPDMYECLVRRAEETKAEIVECGIRQERLNKKIIDHRRTLAVFTGNEAVYELIHGRLSTGVMNKLWRRQCFEEIRFPDGKVYEDIATSYRVFLNAQTVCSIDEIKYHYVLHTGSITGTYSLRNLENLWDACRERYEYLKDRIDEESNKILLRICAKAIVKTWIHYYDFSKKERSKKMDLFARMNQFTKQHFALFGTRGWNRNLRIGIVFPHFNNSVSFRLAGIAYKLHKLLGFES